MKIIHIGLGKTGTTTLQKYFFPKLSNLLNHTYWTTDSKILNKVKIHYSKQILGKDIFDNLQLNDNSFISHEGLSGFHRPDLLEYFANSNLIAFGRNSHIIITIREPLSYLSSIYNELVAKKLLNLSPSDFFLSKKSELSFFNLKEFSYRKLLNVYKKKFDKVSIIKIEKYNDINYLSKIFNLELNLLRSTISDLDKNKKTNRSYNFNTYKIVKSISFLFYPVKFILKLPLINVIFTKILINLVKKKILSDKEYTNYYFDMIKHKIAKEDNSILIDKIFSEIISNIFISLKFFDLIDFIFYRNKKKITDPYEIDKNFSFEITRLNNEYNSI